MQGIYNYYHDAGHGWLAVPVEEIQKLGIEEEISSCSYRKGRMAFLEEDCDAPRFIKACRIQFREPTITEVYDGDSSPIRNFDSFK